MTSTEVDPFGSLAAFVAMWVPMMAAMMLPGSVPAIVRHARERPRIDAVLVFIGAYLAVWTLVGVALYALYRPPGSLVAGVVVIAAGLYELTPLKRAFRERCRECSNSGFALGGYCVGSTIALMLAQLALGIMSMTWMVVVTLLVAAQKLLPARAVIDVPVAIAIVGLGILIVIGAT